MSVGQRQCAVILGLSLVICSVPVLGPAVFVRTASAQFTIPSHVVSGGGVTRTSTDAFALGGTIGQPALGRATGDSFVLRGGFWLGGSATSGIADGPWGIVGDRALPFRLHPPAPNPVSQSTVLTFDLPFAQRARVSIFDASGRLTRLLEDELLPAGRHRSVWDATDAEGRRLASGIYFLRLETGTATARRKIVVQH